MLERIIFFELRHYGDLHITRNLVTHVIQQIPAKNYTYVLNIDKKVLSDIPNLSFETYDPVVHPFSMYDEWKIIDNILYANTSCGTGNMRFFQGTTVQTAHTIFKFYLKELLNYHLSDDLFQFVPCINFSCFKVNFAERFMKIHEDKKKVLIVNGDTMSGQTLNFDMYPLIQLLASEYPKHLFFVSNFIDNLSYRHGLCMCREKSNRAYSPGNNIFLCKDILQIKENDIVECSFFARFCDLIIGRSSGVYTLSIEHENLRRTPKKFICFSHGERDKDLGISAIYPELASNFIWSCNYNYSDMLNLIRQNMR